MSFIFHPYLLCDIENSTQGDLDGEQKSVGVRERPQNLAASPHAA